MIFLKTFVTLIIILVSIFIIGDVFSETVKIPEDSIRLRVVANSNDTYDQQIKKEVAISVQEEISKILDDSDNITTAKIKLKNNMEIIDNKINDTFSKNNYKQNYSINLGLNYFPLKEYKGVEYKEGYYESLMITIGLGQGNNWWCVLFPPLCVLEAEESSEVEYKSLTKEIIDKYVINKV